MLNTNFFDLLYTHLEERPFNVVCESLKQDENYQATLADEIKLEKKYKNLDLSEEQHRTIEQWTDAIHAKNSNFSAVIFRLGMQCCFSLLIQLADLK